MSLLVLQVTIKQWDKSQRTEAHDKLRAIIPVKYPLVFPPAFYAFDQQCVIDLHGDDIQGGRLKYFKNQEGKLRFDRFQISGDDNTIDYFGTESNDTPRRIGSLNNQWIQCKYNHRYSVFESDMYYWLYEEVTLNAISLNTINDRVFLNTEPAIVYEDFKIKN